MEHYLRILRKNYFALHFVLFSRFYRYSTESMLNPSVFFLFLLIKRVFAMPKIPILTEGIEHIIQLTPQHPTRYFSINFNRIITLPFAKISFWNKSHHFFPFFSIIWNLYFFFFHTLQQSLINKIFS